MDRKTEGGKIRVLVVYPHLPHYRYDVFRELQTNERLEVFFAAGMQESRGIAVVPEGALRGTLNLRNVHVGVCLWQRGLLKAILKLRPAVVVFLADPHYVSTWLSAAVCRFLDIKVLFWTIGWSRPETKKWKTLTKRAFFQFADRLLLYSEYGRQLGLQSGVPDSKMKIVYNSSSKPADGLPDSPPRFFEALDEVRGPAIGAVIRLAPRKELSLIVEAAAILRSRGVPVEVLLVGDGSEAPRLRELADGLEVPLHLLGAAYSEAALAAVYRRLEVTVVPSLAGLTTLQSMRHGVPVITHGNADNQAPESEAIFQGRTGAYFSEGDSEALASAIGPFLAMSLSEKEEVAAYCREEVQAHWTPTVQSGLISEAILDSLGSG